MANVGPDIASMLTRLGGGASQGGTPPQEDLDSVFRRVIEDLHTLVRMDPSPEGTAVFANALRMMTNEQSKRAKAGSGAEAVSGRLSGVQ